MRKFVVNILVFFGIIFLIDYCMGVTGDYLHSHAKSGFTRRINTIARDGVYDIMIMGSSRAHHHYDAPFLTDVLGKRVYNAGYDGNGVILADGLLELMIERYSPQLILYDVEPAFDINVYAPDNHNTRYIERIKPFWRHKAVGEIIQDVSKEEWYKVHSGLLRYNSTMVTLLGDYLKINDDKMMGFDPLQGEYKNDVKWIREKEEQDPLKLKYLELFVRKAKEQAVPLVIIASPRLGANTSEELSPIKDICSRYDVPFWDYYTDEKYQRNDFFKEPTHLNKVGAREYSSEIAKKIQLIYNK